MKTIKIKELGIEVESEYHFKDIILKDIKEPKGWRVLNTNEFFWLINSRYAKELGMMDTYEAVKHPYKKCKQKYWALWFRSVDGRSGLFGNGLVYAYSVRGVRFCKEVKP